MSDTLTVLTELTLQLHRPMELDEMLQLIADRTASLVSSPLVSVRLLDASRARLVATCRTGASLHRNRDRRYRLGEGLVGWVAEKCAPLRLGRAEDDPRFLPRSDKEGTLGSFLGIPIVSQGQCVGVLSAVHPAFDYFTEEHEKQMTLLAALIAPRVEPGRRERIAQLDRLTGALNRRGLDRELPAVLDEDAMPSALSAIVVGVDRLAEAIEAHGAAVGDRVLQVVAGVLHESVREDDLVVRWGDEEFLIVLSGTTQSAAEQVADRARASLEPAAIPLPEGPLAITASFGVVQRAPGERRDDTIARAERAMRSAKAKGHNRVETA